MKKLLALLLAGVCLLSLAACAKPAPANAEYDWEDPVYTMDETLENRQKALAATAMAYYYKGSTVQYGRALISRIQEEVGGNLRGRTWQWNTPEEATRDNTVYSWCSTFIFDAVWQTFGYKLLDTAVKCRTVFLSDGDAVPKELLILSHKQTEDPMDTVRAMQEAVSLLQVGDLVTYRAADFGHVMMYVGDVTGDGRGDLVHCGGDIYKISSGTDQVEARGILVDDMEDSFLNPESVRFLGNKERFTVIRPALADAKEYPTSTAAKARMVYPGLRYDRTVSVGCWGSVVQGESLTYTSKITNCSKKDMTGLPVFETVPEGTVLVSCEGFTPGTKTLRAKVDIPAGETVTLSCTVQVVTAETVVAKRGSVAGIPTNELRTTVQTFTPDKANMQGVTVSVKGADGRTFTEGIYNAAFGTNVVIPSVSELLADGFDAVSREKDVGKDEILMYEPKQNLYKTEKTCMLLPMYIGGRRVLTDFNQRVLETRLSDLQAGDIIAARDSKGVDTFWIFDGEQLLTPELGKAAAYGQAELTRLLSYEFFCLLRPSLAAG